MIRKAFWLLGMMAVVFLWNCGGSRQGRKSAKAFDDSVWSPDRWVKVEEEPDWVAAPPVKAEWVRFVLVRRSNLERLAKDRAEMFAKGDAENWVKDCLLNKIEAEMAGKIAKTAAENMKPVRKAVWFQPSPRGREHIPGSSMATAWILWEAPLEKIIQGIPEEEREAVRKALR
ncbi:MAG: hypothetical protein ACYTHM_17670, partial [Planctomycetota bacterium]|jgi:hypothetical protein